MKNDTVSVLEGNTFVVGRRNGDVDAGPGEPHGLFHRDTRHLSRLLLTIDGKSRLRRIRRRRGQLSDRS